MARFVSPSLSVLLTVLLLPFPLKADLVTDWSNNLMDAIRQSETGAYPASREFAMLHTAIYDAVNGVAMEYQSFYVAPAAPVGSMQEAAASAAAYTVLTSLYPEYTSTFLTTYNNQINSFDPGTAKDDGIVWGNLVANTILTWRSNDNSDASVFYTPGTDPGDFRPTGVLDSPQWAGVTPWTLTSPSQFRPPGTLTVSDPAYLTSSQYTADYNEVKLYGAQFGSLRDENQDYSAEFWSYDTGSQTVVGHWNSVAQKAIVSEKYALLESARFFAVLNVAIADAAILSTDAAYTSELWRPLAAIREAGTDNNPSTVADTGWESNIETPQSPSWLSINDTTAGAAARVLNFFEGTETGITITSEGVPGLFFFFESFDEASFAAGEAGIFGGTQFRTAAAEGNFAGRDVGFYVLNNYFGPVPEPSGAGLCLLAAAGLLVRRGRPAGTAVS